MMTNEVIVRGYRRFARWYDIVYGPVLQPGRRAAIRALDLQPRHRVLEVGVGTGLSLPLYPDDVNVTGVDVSGAMLDKARARVARESLTQVQELREMDGQRLEFADSTFDAVLTMYVVSVADDPVALVKEMRRVCKPDGRIVIVNRFFSHNPFFRLFETVLSPLHRLVHHRADLDLEEFVAHSGLEVTSQARANLFHYSTILACRNPPKNA
jgi:phosphatidylethanolamine/phosphatidyl-N-methylethanolamine N-methyltransferase